MFKQLLATVLISVSLVPAIQLSATAGERCETYTEHNRHRTYKSKRCYKQNETSIGEDLAILGGLLLFKGALDAINQPSVPKVETPEVVYVPQTPSVNIETPAWYNVPDGHGGYTRRYCIVKYNEFFCEN
jgi:hypothetical protein